MTNLSAALPFFPPFIPDSDPASTGPRCAKWKKRFEYFLTAMNVTEPQRKRALLLHNIGEISHNIFNTLLEISDSKDYDATLTKLSERKNIEKLSKEKYRLRSICFPLGKAEHGETLDQYTTRLRTPANTCEFTELDKQTKIPDNTWLFIILITTQCAT